ncbi:Mitochondrial substrate carrier family protein B [Ananas comosus]|uniref:Mitochondrial substrate carrier family protein B n=1 Tax=Ananas comosus TaxID=4615 RepID=A0A199VW41_ANACO|nr:Mitochondrial substrate carrier family protein B [Ananas comosus]
MQTEARRVGMVVEGGGQRALAAGHGGGGGGGAGGGGGVTVEGEAWRFSKGRQQQQQQLQQQPQIGSVAHLLAGGVAGAVSKTCTAPLARLTILFQVQGMHSDVATLRKASMWHEASRIVREEGFRAFWKGNLVTIAHRLPYSSISFYTYERYKHLLQLVPGLDRHREYASADICVRLLGGGLAGITAASMTYPLDLVRTRLAAQTNTMYYRGISHALYAICRDEGGVGPSIAISFSVYETLRSHWQAKRPHDSAVLVSLACGSLSGIASSTVTFPIDLVRRRKQLEGAAGRARVYNSGIIGTFRHIVRTEGFRGLYRGILPEYYKVIPSVGIVFMTYETLKAFLSSTTPLDS